MFQSKELNAIDQTYFNVIRATCHCVTLQSKNTKHYWHILHQDYSNFKSCEIYHNHHANSCYHEHGHASTLQKAITQIKSHDAFQLNGRKRQNTLIPISPASAL